MKPAPSLPHIDISAEQWNIVRQILQNFIPHSEVWAFGSRARRNARSFSDLDLAIFAKTPLEPRLAAEIAEAFTESDLPWKVD